MPDAAGEAVLPVEKIVDKMEANQKENGTWQGEGWAPVLSQALASKAINMAKQAGMAVDGDKLDKTAKHGRESFKQFAEGKRGGGAVGFGPVKGVVGFGGNAGVDLYGAAAAISALQDAVNTNRFLSQTAQSVLRTATAAVKDLDDAKRQLAGSTCTKSAPRAAQFHGEEVPGQRFQSRLWLRRRRGIHQLRPDWRGHAFQSHERVSGLGEGHGQPPDEFAKRERQLVWASTASRAKSSARRRR